MLFSLRLGCYRLALISFFALSLLAAPSALAEGNDELYYAAKSAFAVPKDFEFRAGFGYDFSNPHLNVFSGHASAFWLFDSSMAFGVEGTLYSSSIRATTEELIARLEGIGDPLVVDRPSWSTVAVFRITPISGLVNFFSHSILEADINVTARGGVVNYDGLGSGPIFGLGFETVIGITPTYGFHAGITWDLEKPGDKAWQWRSGFKIGPWVRF